MTPHGWRWVAVVTYGLALAVLAAWFVRSQS